MPPIGVDGGCQKRPYHDLCLVDHQVGCREGEAGEGRGATQLVQRHGVARATACNTSHTPLATWLTALMQKLQLLVATSPRTRRSIQLLFFDEQSYRESSDFTELLMWRGNVEVYRSQS